MRGDALARAWTCDGTDVLERLSAFDRALLGTNGTVTAMLSAQVGEPVRIQLLGQEVTALLRPDDALELGAGRLVLTRRAVVHGTLSGTRLLYDSSRLALGRLTLEMRADLCRGDLPIGAILAKHRMKTFRRPLDAGVGWPRSEVAEELGDREMCHRSYAVIAGVKPVMLVHQEFPVGALSSRLSSSPVSALRESPAR